MPDGDGVCLSDPVVDVFVGRLPGEYALVVAVVFQGHQDTERAVVQWNNRTHKRKVRIPVQTGVLTFAAWQRTVILIEIRQGGATLI